MDDEQHAAIRDMLAAHTTITLATADGAEAWAATVFYASDADLNLYFVSDYRTRHARDIAAGSECAAAINADVDDWLSVKGLQLRGRVEVLDGMARARALGIYLMRFADVRALFEKPKDDNEETIAQRLKAANLYRLQPTWIRLIDNSRWFGYKFEVEIPSLRSE